MEEDEEDEGDTDESEMISLVALVGEAPFLDDAVLAHAAGKAWNAEFGTGDDDNSSYVVGEDAPWIIGHEDWFFIVHRFETPYFEDAEEMAEHATDLRIREAITGHSHWFSIDLLNGPEE